MATLCLCGGLQSSGSTLVSWSFLQRADVNGVLDGNNDLLPRLIRPTDGKIFWYKTTISCFRLSELVQHFRDDGWEVRPLLVVRDVRRVWSSLIKKPYARSGITAEDPPLRLRFRRFLADWELFRQQGWPILRYESLVAEPRKSLRQACRELRVEWDEGMLRWPKQPQQIASTTNGNETFWATRAGSLSETLARHVQHFDPAPVAAADWQWLEGEFRAFNVANNYPVSIALPAIAQRRAIQSAPSFEATRRYQWETKRKPLRWLLSTLGIANRPLVERRSIRRVA